MLSSTTQHHARRYEPAWLLRVAAQEYVLLIHMCSRMAVHAQIDSMCLGDTSTAPSTPGLCGTILYILLNQDIETAVVSPVLLLLMPQPRPPQTEALQVQVAQCSPVVRLCNVM
jgi:hypothetical protein